VQEVVPQEKTIQDSGRKHKWPEAPPTLNPQMAEKHFKLAEEKYHARRYYEAERNCVEAIRSNPREAKYHHLMALSLAHHPHSIHVVEESFQKAIQLAPNHLDYRLDFANFLKSQKRLDDATDECQKILKLSPDNKRANTLLMEIALEK
jgi:Tfp pilus assembly protein PilF